MKTLLLFILVVLISYGCAVPHRDDTYGQLPFDQSSFLNEGFVSASSQSIEHTTSTHLWWQQFNDPVTNRLVEQAVLNNLDLKIATANIQESEALLKSVHGSRWPQLNLTASGERSFTGSNTGSSFSASNQRVYTSTILTGASISWQSDLFGKLRSQQLAASSEWQASQIDYEAMLHSVIANVIRHRVLLAITLQRLEVAAAILDSHENTRNIVTRRYNKGIRSTSAVDLALARENVYAAQASITRLQQDAAITQHALDVLIGRAPQSLFVSTHKLNALPALESTVVGTPIELLDRRPDLRAAKLRTLADKARVSIAMADLYPNLTIQADIGWRDTEFSDLFSPVSLFARLLGQFVQPVFSGSRLRAEVAASKAHYEAEIARYVRTVLIAIKEVEDGLIRNKKLRQRLSQVENQVHEARRAQNLSQMRYQKGIENLLTVLETQRRRRNAEDQLLQTTLEYWHARIDLYLAVGGSWLDTNKPMVTEPILFERDNAKS